MGTVLSSYNSWRLLFRLQKIRLQCHVRNEDGFVQKFDLISREINSNKFESGKKKTRGTYGRRHQR